MKKTVLLLVFILLFSTVYVFSQPKVVGDPMVKITSLPLEQDLNDILPLIRLFRDDWIT